MTTITCVQTVTTADVTTRTLRLNPSTDTWMEMLVHGLGKGEAAEEWAEKFAELFLKDLSSFASSEEIEDLKMWTEELLKLYASKSNKIAHHLCGLIVSLEQTSPFIQGAKALLQAALPSGKKVDTYLSDYQELMERAKLAKALFENHGANMRELEEGAAELEETIDADFEAKYELLRQTYDPQIMDDLNELAKELKTVQDRTKILGTNLIASGLAQLKEIADSKGIQSSCKEVLK